MWTQVKFLYSYAFIQNENITVSLALPFHFGSAKPLPCQQCFWTIPIGLGLQFSEIMKIQVCRVYNNIPNVRKQCAKALWVVSKNSILCATQNRCNQPWNSFHLDAHNLPNSILFGMPFELFLSPLCMKRVCLFKEHHLNSFIYSLINRF